MTILQERLADLRRLLRFVVLYRGLALIFVACLGCVIAEGLLDRSLRLPSLVRALLLVGALSSGVYLTWRCLIRPIWGKTDDLTLALRVEEQFPVLNDALASAVQFQQQGPDAERGDSSSLRHETMERALRLAEGCYFSDVVDTRGVFLSSFAALLVGGLGAFLLWSAPSSSYTALLRFLDPYGDHTWTELTIEPNPPRVALGAPYVVRGQVGGIVPEQATIEVQGLTDTERDRHGEIEKRWLPIKPPSDKDPRGKLEVALDMTQQRGKFRFRIRAGDATYPKSNAWREIDVVPPPRLVALDGLPSPQSLVRPPAYTGLPSPEKLSPGIQNIEAVAGSVVSMRAAVDRPIAQAWIEYRSPAREAAAGLALTTRLHALGASHFLDQLGIAWGTEIARARIPTTLTDDGLKFSTSFMPWLTGSYLLHLEDGEGISREYELTIRVQPDPPPFVTLERPGSNQDVLADAEIGLKVQAVDDFFAVKSMYLEYRRQDADGNWLDDAPKRLPLYESTFAERQKRVEASRRWPLKGLAREGERLVLQACADDFNDVAAFPEPGRSAEVVLRIVSPRELAKKVDEDFGQIQQELVRIQHMQNEAIGQAEKIKENIDKPGFRPREALAETEQKQKQIQARVGDTPEEGLRAEIEKLKQLLNDNKLPPSDVRDRLRTLSLELERLSREHLQQIEPALAEARKQLGDKAAKEKTPDKSDKKTAFEKAREHQNQAKKGLDDLVKFMEPWASMQQVKGTARQLLDQQRDVKKASEKLDKQSQSAQQLAKKIEELTQKLQDLNPQKLEAEREKLQALAKEDEARFQKEAGKAAAAQNQLAEKMEDLLRLMENVQKKRAEDGDKQSAKVLKEAAEQADKGLIADKMRQAKRALEVKDANNKASPKTSEALRNQAESIEQLEKVLAALEERRDDQVDKLLQKQRQAEETLDQLRKKQDVLAKKTKEHKEEIDKLAKKQRDIKDKLEKKQGDPDKLKAEQQALQKQAEEHQRELAKLADEQRKLKDEAQEKARELARLHADQASQALSKAGREMERAAKMLDDGQDPAEAQAEALERIDDAQVKLEEAEDELAREQLAKIADRLKGLKERQDNATAESARLHKQSIEKQKHWTDPLLKSLKGLARAQKGLGQETDRLKDKLKNAKVFAHILDKSVKAMDEAAGSLDRRFDKGLLRQEALEKEELIDEARSQDETQRLQNEASRRLQRLLDALKDQKPQTARRPRPKDNEKEKEKKEDDKGGLRGPGDGIPDMAQLKALRDEQQEVHDRTKDFAKRFPAWPKLEPAQKDREADIQTEFGNIQAEQTAIQRLFEDITARSGKKGDNP